MQYINTVGHSWLRQHDISPKFAGSICDSVTGNFHFHNPSARTMALGSTQLLTKISTRNNALGVKAAGA